MFLWSVLCSSIKYPSTRFFFPASTTPFSPSRPGAPLTLAPVFPLFNGSNHPQTVLPPIIFSQTSSLRCTPAPVVLHAETGLAQGNRLTPLFGCSRLEAQPLLSILLYPFLRWAASCNSRFLRATVEQLLFPESLLHVTTRALLWHRDVRNYQSFPSSFTILFPVRRFLRQLSFN